MSSLLIGCGGGGGDPESTTPANRAPTSHAGAAQNVTTGTVVTLNGSASTDADGDALSYRWTLSGRPAGSTATLSNVTIAAPTFAVDVAGVYQVALVVNDGKVDGATANVTITATVANAAPVANAGTAQNVIVGSTVLLDGRTSSDANGDSLSYQWTLTTRPAGSNAALNSSVLAQPTFAADIAGSYTARLVVSDGLVSSAPATVTITAAAANVAPVAVAGDPQRVLAPGTPVLLNGAASSDANNDALSYRWTLTSKPNGSVAQLSSTTSAQPGFSVDKAGTYVAQLVVNDGRVDSAPSTVMVTAAPLFAWAAAFQATTASYTANESYNSYSDSYKNATIARLGTGSYSVRFPGLGRRGSSIKFVTLATAVSAFTPVKCVAGPATFGSGVHLDVSVKCSTTGGTLADSQFNVLVVGEQALDGMSVFAAVDASAAQPVAPSQWSSSGTAVRTDQVGTGMTRVAWGLPLNSTLTYMSYVGAHDSLANFCLTTAANDNPLTVRCFDGSGAPSKTSFDILVLDAGRSGHPWAWVYANDTTGVQQPGGREFRTSTNQGVQAIRRGTGQYSMVMRGLGTPGAQQRKSVIVSAAGTAAFCSIEGWGAFGSEAEMRVDLSCYAANGAPVDSRYSVLVLE